MLKKSRITPFKAKSRTISKNVSQSFAAIALYNNHKVEEAYSLCMQLIAQGIDDFDCQNLVGVICLQRGKPKEAIDHFLIAIKKMPSNLITFSNLASAYLQLGEFTQAFECVQKLEAISKPTTDTFFIKGSIYFQQKKYIDAINNFKNALKIDPQNYKAHNNLGIALREIDDLCAAEDSFRNAIRLKPDYADAHNNLGSLLIDLKKTKESLGHFNIAVRINPNYVDAFYNRGNALFLLQLIHEAIESYQRAIELNPNYHNAFNNLGLAYRKIDNFQNAQLSFEQAISVNPCFTDAYNNLGTLMLEQKQDEKALHCFDQALAINPKLPSALANRGNVLLSWRQFQGALECFKLALSFSPNHSESFNSLGSLMREQGKLTESATYYLEAIKHKPENANAHFNLGHIYSDLKRFDEARSQYQKTLDIDPNFEFALGLCLHLKMRLCDWQGFDTDLKRIKDIALKTVKLSSPFPILGLIDDPLLQLAVARIYSASKHPIRTSTDAVTQVVRSKKIRIAYYSADFYSHATAHLMIELFESHDRERFEVYGFSFGATEHDSMRTRLISCFDQFIDVTERGDAEVAAMSIELGIDIAIDLKGFTTSARTNIFANRCAPIQVSYLGYPGTMGSDYYEYIIADAVLIPKDDQKYYSEKVVYLPNSYQVNDSKRTISSRVFSRQEVGLPEQGFIFCCFNNNYKILPHTFDIWMRILQAVPESALWLFEDNPTATQNLHKEAKARGVEPSRLIFAKRLPLDEHLARHRLADLFLDTLPYNAHTTASDALWAGLPVLTLIGESFAARVAASLLTAMDLPELITHTLEEYEAKALELALNPHQLAAIKAKLERNRLTSPLFNGKLFAKHLESAYISMYERWQAGLPVDHIVVSPEPLPESPNVLPELPAADITVLPDAGQASVVVKTTSTPLKALGFLNLDRPIQVMDIGASVIAEVPIYKVLLDRGLGYLHAFEGDERQIAKIREAYGGKTSIYDAFLFDGSKQTLYLASEASGMTSLLKPREAALQFFNGFTEFGKILKTETVQTQRLDDIVDLPQIDFVKMDIQGAELTVLKHGLSKLKECVAIQLEVSYVCLYENQPSFGDIDVWLRSCGFSPHCFLDVKRWSIAPTIFNNNFRVSGNQLLESDVVYIKDPLKLELMTEGQIKNLITLAHYCFKSVDLCVYLILELQKRGAIAANQHERYLQMLATPEDKHP